MGIGDRDLGVWYGGALRVGHSDVERASFSATCYVCTYGHGTQSWMLGGTHGDADPFVVGGVRARVAIVGDEHHLPGDGDGHPVLSAGGCGSQDAFGPAIGCTHIVV